MRIHFWRVFTFRSDFSVFIVNKRAITLTHRCYVFTHPYENIGKQSNKGSDRESRG